MTYYAVIQDGGMLHSGRNTTSKEELRADLIEYVKPDMDDTPDKYSLDDVLEIWGFRLVEQEEPFEDEGF